MESLPFFCCHWYSVTKYTEFQSIKLWMKYTCTNYFKNILRTEKARGKVGLTALYFSHPSFCKVSNIWCLSVQNARILLQLEYHSLNVTVHVKFTKQLRSLSLSWWNSMSQMCMKTLTGHRHNFSGSHVVHGLGVVITPPTIHFHFKPQ